MHKPGQPTKKVKSFASKLENSRLCKPRDLSKSSQPDALDQLALSSGITSLPLGPRAENPETKKLQQAPSSSAGSSWNTLSVR